jgi:hypothetical protein
MTRVLILNAPAESGKGTVSAYLKILFKLNMKEYSSIDYVKEVAREKFRWDGEKTPEGRNLLAGIKQVMIAYNDMPTQKVIAEIEWAIRYKLDLLIVDIREPDEIEKLVTYCEGVELECYTCRIHNEQAETRAETSGLSLTGDRLYGEYDYDIDIYNNGTLEDLERYVAESFGRIFNGE